jgi:hypothetical protein
MRADAVAIGIRADHLERDPMVRVLDLVFQQAWASTATSESSEYPASHFR